MMIASNLSGNGRPGQPGIDVVGLSETRLPASAHASLLSISVAV